MAESLASVPQVNETPILLGPFELRTPIGRGGMAEVWRGVHIGQQIPVAIKVLTAKRAREPHFLTAFRNEVQAVARLHHPGIVLIFDHGEVTQAAAKASGDRLLAGSPYLAMELASWGSLDRVRMPLEWNDLFRLLLSLLDALAHAHARGVIHRDLKPGNILLCAREDVRPGLKLTDFGIAHALEHEVGPGTSEASSGTPHFMSPEQFLGGWRDYGPWTDLYAVGCVAHVLASGNVPFKGENVMQLAWAHINLTPPKLEPPQPLPSGFERWVHRLMAKDPRQRFQRAADAGWMLMMLNEAHRRKRSGSERGEGWVWQPSFLFSPSEGTSSVDPAEDPTQVIQRTVPATMFDATELLKGAPPSQIPADTPTELDPRSSEPTHAQETLAQRRIPPLPRSWRRATQQERSMQLVGAGLGLYGLRSIPMVDRDSERDAIWEALRTVRETKTARLLLLHGASGNGKSRLVEWMSQRADEVGSAIVTRASHGPIPGPLDGIARMVARQLRCFDLNRKDARARIAQILRAQGETDEAECDALLELILPTAGAAEPAGSADHGAIRFGSATERHVLIRRLYERLARERPVIVWLDDVQWGSDALSFASHVLKVQPQTPSATLFLLTARDEALADRPVESELVEALMKLPNTARLPIPPLAPPDQRKLVEELLVLEDLLVKDVAERTGGNPLFAVQLVGDWVQRGVLEVGRAGFVLQPGEEAELPDDIHQVWAKRIERVLSSQPAGASVALEIAGVLGRDVDTGEWEAACREAGVEFPPRLLDALLQSRLAQPVDGGWTFAHGMLRESLERAAKEGGRFEAYHRASAQMLLARYGIDSPGIAERLGVHQLSAGDLEAAQGPLLQGARERSGQSEYAAALALIDLREDALRALGASEDDERWGQGWVLAARVAVLQGSFADARRWTERAERQARRWGWRKVLPDAIAEQAATAYERGDQSRAIELFEEAIQLYQWNQDELGIARCHLGIADAIYRRGELSQAGEKYQHALQLYELHGDAVGMASCLLGMGYVALWQNDLDQALALFERELGLVETIGDRFRIARCVTGLGEVARQSGKLAEAEAHYRRALAIDEAIGSHSAWVDRANLGLVLLTRSEYAQAYRVVLDLLAGFGGSGEPAQLAIVHTQMLPCLAEARDWDGWDRHFEQATRVLADTGLKDGDVAWMLELAGQRAAAAGDGPRAQRAYELSVAQWKALQRFDRAVGAAAAANKLA